MGDWNGPRRATALEAAQDYCDYVNSLQATPATPALRQAGHSYQIDEQDTDPEYLAALGVLRDRRAQKEGKQGYVYLITDGEYLKIGYSVNPPKRVAELQTGNARLLSLVGTIEGTEEDERLLHAKYARHNVLQEWFELHEEILAEFGVNVKAAA